MANQLLAKFEENTRNPSALKQVRLPHGRWTYPPGGRIFPARVACDLALQRSLSNTEDECTHLKEMNERTQEELRELANKYNGAVNEIKDLSDKLKVCILALLYCCDRISRARYFIEGRGYLGLGFQRSRNLSAS